MTAVTSTTPRRLAVRERLHVPRSRGAASGFLLLLLGLWGALIPLVGPLFSFSFTPDTAWDLTTGRLWLEILPGAVTFVGGLILLASTNRVTGWVGAWLAVVAGAWFAVGQQVSRLWNNGVALGGAPAQSGTLHSVAAQITFFSGLGVLVVFLGATALGRMSVIGVRDVAMIPDQRVDRAPAEAPVVRHEGDHVRDAQDEPIGTDRSVRHD